MVRLDADPHRALARLRAHAFSHGQNEPARDVIAGRTVFRRPAVGSRAGEARAVGGYGPHGEGHTEWGSDDPTERGGWDGVTAGEHAQRRTQRPVPSDAAEARSVVADLLDAAPDRAGFPVRGTARADILLVTSELVTNAFRHGGGLTGFAAGLGRGTVTLTVSDASDDVPRTASTHHAMSEGGFGWQLVCLLADQVAVTLLPDGGKSIRVRLPLVS
ncbi:ATP-binding protein [Streptomyces sp. NPDC054883]